MTNPRPSRLLVICTGNRARSQMAHGWLRSLGGDNVEVTSAGTNPNGVHPMAVRVMDEVGIDISSHTSDHVDQYVEDDFDLVITVCDSARESCPVIPGAKRVPWSSSIPHENMPPAQGIGRTLLKHPAMDPDAPGRPLRHTGRTPTAGRGSEGVFPAVAVRQLARLTPVPSGDEDGSEQP